MEIMDNIQIISRCTSTTPRLSEYQLLTKNVVNYPSQFTEIDINNVFFSI